MRFPDVVWTRSRAPTWVALLVGVAAAGPAAAADEPRWSVDLEPMRMLTYGHDQHVLTITRRDTDASPARREDLAIGLDSGDGSAFGGRIERVGDAWGFGFDWFWFRTKQGLVSQREAAGGPWDEVTYTVAGRAFTSTAPGETLYYTTVGDTDLIARTFDLYALRRLAGDANSNLGVRMGLRIGDFDNDYVSFVGVEGVGGRGIDSESNYPNLVGPMLALDGIVEQGRHRFRGYLGQSLITGYTEVRNDTTEFDGNPDAPIVTEEGRFYRRRDVGLPISELRIAWSYSVTPAIAVGLGARAAAWWDVAVPPGAVPTSEGDGGTQTLHENTIVFYGLQASLRVAW